MPTEPTTSTRHRSIISKSLAAAAVGVAALAATITPAAAVPDPGPTQFWDEATAGLSVSGTYTPIVGDFAGSTQDDIIWYAPGPATDHLWVSDNDGTFSKSALSSQVNGSYRPIVGNFAGSSRDDIFWYAPGAGPDSLWTTTASGFTSTPKPVNGTYAPVVLDDQVGLDDIVWAGPHGGPGSIWSFEGGGSHISNAFVAPAGSRPLTGLFTNGNCADLFWYAPGPGQDALWAMSCAGVPGEITPFVVNGHYTPTVNRYDGGDGPEDILWYSPGASTLWRADGESFFNEPVNIGIAGTPLPVSWNYGLVHLRSPGADSVWWRNGVGSRYHRYLSNTDMSDHHRPLVGNFVGNNADIFWYAPGAGPERLFSKP